jgi:hypothetical protein
MPLQGLGGSVGLDLVRELVQLVEVDAGPEAEHPPEGELKLDFYVS